MPDPAVLAVGAVTALAIAWPYLPWTRAASRRRQLRAYRDRLRELGLLPPGWTVGDIQVLPPPAPSDGAGGPEDDDG